MSHKTLRDLIEVRRMIEIEAAGLAAQRATKAHLHTLEKDVQRLADSLHLKEEIPEDIGFHLTVLQAADNSVLATLSKVIEEFYAVDGQPPNGRDVAQHRAIYEAIRDGDAERARDAMAQHLRFVEDSLFRLIDSQSDGRERESS
jgi:GntR family transcriptional repressor for pyruvate dehydrogenase complex